VSDNQQKQFSNVLSKRSKSLKSGSAFGLIVIILLVWSMMTAAGAYLLRDMIATENERVQNSDIESLREELKNVNDQLIEEKAKNLSGYNSQVCAAVLPSSSAIENIKASIMTGNTAVLEGYMANNVNVILAASEGVGEVGRTEAISNVTNFVSDSINTWDFSLSESELESYRSGDYNQYFPAVAVVGKSTNNKVISFSFCGDKIDTVFLASSFELLN
jgi:hypothetical protein